METRVREVERSEGNDRKRVKKVGVEVVVQFGSVWEGRVVK